MAKKRKKWRLAKAAMQQKEKEYSLLAERVFGRNMARVQSS
jgi:hypothetical protein